MKAAIWRTGHEIADTVADAIKEGMPDADIKYPSTATISDEQILASDAHVAYGVLRGCDAVFKTAYRCGVPYIHLDRGYFSPSHYDGYYRVSLNGTQQTNLHGIDPDYTRLAKLNLDIKPWRGLDHSKPVLVCPPTEAVREFFDYTGMAFDTDYRDKNYVVRRKGSYDPINFNDYNYVLTFNSSVGWQALMAGIPCISDPTHSIVGSFFHEYNIKEKLSENYSFAMYKGRMRLFGCMASLQLTLNEMREGKLWPLMERLMSGSGMIQGSHPVHTLQPIPSTSAQTQN